MKIREISQDDNSQVSEIIKRVLESFGAVGDGYACADPEVEQMYETYQAPRSKYYVIEEGNKILGGAGIGPLKNEASHVCELQKMYFLPALRGKGFGNKLIELCLEDALSFHYSSCYLETLPNMAIAQALYKKHGFEYIDHRMGGTGHSKCPVWMLKQLT